MLGENRKWSDISDFDLVLSIETLDKVSGTESELRDRDTIKAKQKYFQH